MILRAEGKPQMKRFKPLKFPKMINLHRNTENAKMGLKRASSWMFCFIPHLHKILKRMGQGATPRPISIYKNNI